MTYEQNITNGRIVKLDQDGNSFIRIPYVIIAILTTIFIATVPAVMAYGMLNEKVSGLEKDHADNEPRYSQIIDTIEQRLNALEQIAAGTEVSLRTIQEDIQEIKQDLKDLKMDIHST